MQNQKKLQQNFTGILAGKVFLIRMLQSLRAMANYISSRTAPSDDSENAQLEMLSLQTRVGAKIDGGNVLGAKLSGVIETDFFATAEEYSRQIRMRHAFMKLKWEKSSLLMGHYWHPMFGPDVFPKMIQFGAGVIYNPLNRAPQIRFDHYPIEKLRISAVAL
jgi:hypothetical protein